MPKIFELLGFPLTDRSISIEKNRKRAVCPFMDVTCDGGGNRYSSQIDLSSDLVSEKIKEYFNTDKKMIQSGVCSIDTSQRESPWIVCPHRLLVLGKKEKQVFARNQDIVIKKLLQFNDFPPNTELGVWSEVRIRYSTTDDETENLFDYRFDYVIMPLKRQSIAQLANQVVLKEQELIKILIQSQYDLYLLDDEMFVDRCPSGMPLIVEVMTSSTSGGNKRLGTTVSQAFQDAILQREHKAPSINKRQVWARMVSQLIVKSQIGKEWGGRTFWIVQDNLVKYISSTTGLNIFDFKTNRTSDVNLLSFTYSDANTVNGVINLAFEGLFAGPIKPLERNSTSFLDIITIGTIPPKNLLLQKLIIQKPVNIIEITPTKDVIFK